MGLIRGGVIIVLGILFFLSIISSVFFLSLSSSLEYENVRSHFSPIASNFFLNSNLNDILQTNLSKFQSYCSVQEQVEYVLGSYFLVISCDTLSRGKDFTFEYLSSLDNGVNLNNLNSSLEKDFAYLNDSCSPHEYFIFPFSEEFGEYNLSCSSLENVSSLNEEVSKQFVNNFYYADYNCNFFNCFTNLENPLFIYSSSAKSYFNGKYYFFLTSSIILLILFIFSYGNVVWSLILSGIIVFVGTYISKYITKLIISIFDFSSIEKILEQFSLPSFSFLIEILFSKSSYAIIFFNIFGITLIILGIVWWILWVFVFREKKLDKKDVESIVKNVLRKEQKK